MHRVHSGFDKSIVCACLISRELLTVGVTFRKETWTIQEHMMSQICCIHA